MLDIRYIQENKQDVILALANRNADVDIDALLSAYEERKKLIAESDILKAERNTFSKDIGKIIKAGGSAEDAKEKLGKSERMFPCSTKKFEIFRLKLKIIFFIFQICHLKMCQLEIPKKITLLFVVGEKLKI